jgi:hypothetical protein
LSFGRANPDLDKKRQMIRGNPRERCAHDLDPHDINRSADEDVIQTEHRQPSWEGGFRGGEVGQFLGITETCGNPLIGA